MGSPSSFMRSKSAFIKTEGEDEVHSIFREAKQASSVFRKQL